MTAVVEMLDRIFGDKGIPSAAEPRMSEGTSQPLPLRNGDSARLAAMQRAFCSTGGMLSGDAFSLMLRERSDQPISLLARRIVGRQIVSFEAHGQRWLPMFQFEPVTLCVTVPTQRVIAEMRDVLDDWELTDWFASPNVWLDGDSPAHAIATDAVRVFEVARADRFVAAGN